jgi:endonuclease/exonuclease/phosphatase family metal-dependent hydrolase
VPSGGWDYYGCNRICLYALLKEKTTGKTFVFYNTHFGFGDENQVKSVRLIRQYMQKFASSPLFITGDFNMTPSAPAYEVMIETLSDANEKTANDRRSTYHAYAPQDEKNMHIDYCFVNEKVQPVAFKIIDELVDGKFPSDHYGIYAELEIR